MAKKFSLIIAAVVALAVAVPAMASASTGLTMPANTLVPINTGIQGVSTNSVVKNTKFGTLTCKEVKLLGKVTVNEGVGGSAGTGVEGVGTGEQTGTSCTVGTQTAEVKEIKLTNIKSAKTESGTGTASFTFTAILPGPLTCKFTGSSVPGTYVSGGSVLKITEGTLSVTPASCVSTTPKLSGEYTLSTTATGGGAVFIM